MTYAVEISQSPKEVETVDTDMSYPAASRMAKRSSEEYLNFPVYVLDESTGEHKEVWINGKRFREQE